VARADVGRGKIFSAMTPRADLPVVDRVVFETSTVRIGAFRCPTDHPSFADSGPIRDHCFVFPRTPVVIQHKDRRPFAADPTLVTLYNRGQEYRRRPVGASGDRCDWYAVSDTLLHDALTDFDPAASDNARQPIRFAFARTDAVTYWRQRQLFARVSRDGCRDALAIEESVCALLDRVLASAYSCPDWSQRATMRPRAADDLARAACELLGRRFAEPLTLAEIAVTLGTSVFHLCRAFKQATGTTLHEYRIELRLRSALDSLELADCDLCALALDLGFSSHSHFTASFHRRFGATPSAARRRVCATS
jgi:AraC-like DNA-binding protein